MSDCERCAERELALAAMGEAEEQHAQVIGDLERDLRALRATRTRLENQLNDKDADDKHLPAAEEVFEFWKAEISPTARKFKGKRRRNVLDRLKDGWTVDELKDAIRGAKVDAAVSEKGVRYDELELICREEEKVRLNIQRWQAYQARVAPSPAPKPVPRPPNLEPVVLPHYTVLRRKNRLQLIAHLTDLFGPPLPAGDGWLSSPCPRCDGGAGPAGFVLPLRIWPEGTQTLIARCSNCGVDDYELIRDLGETRYIPPTVDETEVWWLRTRVDILEHVLEGLVAAAGGDWPEKGSPYAGEIGIARATLGYAVEPAVHQRHLKAVA